MFISVDCGHMSSVIACWCCMTMSDSIVLVVINTELGMCHTVICHVRQ